MVSFSKAAITMLLIIGFLSAADLYTQWVLKSSGITNPIVLSIEVKDNKIFAGTQGNGVFVSSDLGESWTQTSLNFSMIRALFVHGGIIYAATLGNSLYISNDDGISWQQKIQTVPRFTCFATDGNKVYAGTTFYGLHLSEDNGETWNRISFNLNNVSAVLSRPGKLMTGNNWIYNDGLYISTDGGVMWDSTSLNYTHINDLSDNGNRIFAGADSNGVLYSDDEGLNWVQTPLSTQNVTDIYIFEDYVFAGTFQGGLFVSHNNGINWEPKNGGLATNSIDDITRQNKYIFLATRGGVYRAHLKDILSLQPVSSVIPKSYGLSQNYPNPFNPLTKIKFDIPADNNRNGIVSLILYDAIGKEVETLVNEELRPGSYEIEWNASAYPSGVYFYTLRSSDYNSVRKMVLVK
jgi:photosystem II stability/assembly factor-like uncharacterized protein